MSIKTTPIILILSFAGCVQPKVFHHDVNMAAKSAERFATLSFVTNDFQKGHSLLLEKYQKELPLQAFIKVIEEMHPNGYPTQIKATGFEPVPGQAAMRIFLEGKINEKCFITILSWKVKNRKVIQSRECIEEERNINLLSYEEN